MNIWPVHISFSKKIHKWIDETGNIGFINEFAKIPEKDRKAAMLEGLEAPFPTRIREQPQRAQPWPPSDAPGTDDAGHDRAYWEGRIQELRERRAGLIGYKNEIEQELELADGLYSIGGDPKYLKLRWRYLEELAETEDDIKDVDYQLEDVLRTRRER